MTPATGVWFLEDAREVRVLKKLFNKTVSLFGGKERAKIIVILGLVYGLDGADKGTVGALAVQLQKAIDIDKTQVGLLLTASLGMGALATIPFGILVDKVHRIRLLAFVIITWGIAMILGGCATSFVFMLLTRIFLGGVTACAGPAVVSLLGDYFHPEERAKIFGYIISGELIGTGIGFLIAGEIGQWIWRAGFIALGLPAFFLAWAVWTIAEPKRGGASWLKMPQGGDNKQQQERKKIQQLAQQQNVQPREKLLIKGDIKDKSWWWSFKYTLRIPSNLVLILASAFGYFYFAGIRTFGVQYLRSWYDISHSEALFIAIPLGVGAIIGAIISGRLADKLIAAGHLRARIIVATIAYFTTVAFFLPGAFTKIVWLGVLLFSLGAVALGAMNPPLDAARLDIMVSHLWRRAESVRIFLRKAGEAAAPFAFGFVAQHIFGENISPGGAGEVSQASAKGLHSTFLFMMMSVGMAGAVALVALRTYTRDVVTALKNSSK